MTKTPPPTLRDLIAAPVEIPVGAVRLTVKPLGWYDAIDTIDAIAPALATMPPPPNEGQQVDPAEWLAWINLNRDAVVKFCSLASGQDEDTVAAIPPTALIELVFGLFEVNADFFIASLPGAMSGLAVRVGNLQSKVQALQSSMSGNT